MSIMGAAIGRAEVPSRWSLARKWVLRARMWTGLRCHSAGSWPRRRSGRSREDPPGLRCATEYRTNPSLEDPRSSELPAATFGAHLGCVGGLSGGPSGGCVGSLRGCARVGTVSAQGFERGVAAKLGRTPVLARRSGAGCRLPLATPDRPQTDHGPSIRRPRIDLTPVGDDADVLSPEQGSPVIVGP